MIIQQNGRYYIALSEGTELNDIILYQDGLMELLKIASTAQTFDGAQDTVFLICCLCQELAFTPTQALEIERLPVHKIFKEEISGITDN